MNKAELVAAVADASGMTKQAAGAAVDATFAAITAALFTPAARLSGRRTFFRELFEGY